MLEPGDVDPPKATSVFGVTDATSVLVSTVGTMVFDVMGRAPRVSAEVLTSPGMVFGVVLASPDKAMLVSGVVLTSPGKAMLVSGVVGTDPPNGEIGVKPVPTLGASLLCNVLNTPDAEAISRPLPLLEVVAKSDPLKAEPRIKRPP